MGVNAVPVSLAEAEGGEFEEEEYQITALIAWSLPGGEDETPWNEGLAPGF